MNEKELNKIAKKIKLIALDNDGVLTDGHVYINDHSRGRSLQHLGVTKSYDIRDGLGIIMARNAGITFAIITGLKSPIVEERARQLGIEEVHQALFDKSDVLKNLLVRYKLEYHEAAYMGDDIIDIPVFSEVGLSAAPANAHAEVVSEAKWVATKNGGYGAVREMIDLILSSQGKQGDFVKGG